MLPGMKPHFRRHATLLAVVATCLMPAAFAQGNWAKTVVLPKAEKAIPLFNEKDLTGWEGQIEKYWSVEPGVIRGANIKEVPASTYLFTKQSFRNFRLLFEVKQTRGEKFSTTHSAVAILGEKFTDRGDPFSFKGPLVMFCNDWGVWDANRRNRVFPPRYPTTWLHPVEKVGDWNQIELLVNGDHIRKVVNGQVVMDYFEEPGLLKPSPIGLQLHSNAKPQEFRFRGLILTENPEEKLLTYQRPATP